MRIVLRNLVDNAARQASSRVSFSIAERDGAVVLRVDDDGPGIPAADRERVFDRCVRLDESRGRAAGGAGLGLSIVAELVAAHGGTVAIADSDLGGAQFEVRLDAWGAERGNARQAVQRGLRDDLWCGCSIASEEK